MPQSLIQLPETADFYIGGWPITIRNHKVVDVDGGLISRIIDIVHDTMISRGMLDELEKHGISFEAAIEYSVAELEQDAKGLTDVIYSAYHTETVKVDNRYYFWNVNDKFSSSDAGRKITSLFVEKIRSCDNWGELYDEMHLTSEFIQDIKNRIPEEVKYCPKV